MRSTHAQTSNPHPLYLQKQEELLNEIQNMVGNQSLTSVLKQYDCFKLNTSTMRSKAKKLKELVKKFKRKLTIEELRVLANPHKGKPLILTHTTESIIADMIADKALMANALSIHLARCLAVAVAMVLEPEHVPTKWVEEGCVSDEWWGRFRDSYKEQLYKKRTKAIAIHRLLAIRKDNIDFYFKLLALIIVTYKIKCGNVIGVDETMSMLNH